MSDNKKGKKGKDALMDADDVEDACFDKSPFSTVPMINLKFKRGDSLSIHPALLQRNPKLALLATSASYDPSGGLRSEPLSLKHISRAAGHILVQYLYTGNYFALKWMGPAAGCEETIAKLKTGFEVYATAREYELEGLEELAKEQISILSKGVDAFTIIDVVKEVYPSSVGKDTWFPTYMKANIKAAFEDSATLLASEVPSEDESKEGISIAKVILRGALEVYREMVKALPTKDASVTTELLTPVTSPSQEEDDEWGSLVTAKKKNTTIWAIEEPTESQPQPGEMLKPEPEKEDQWGLLAKKDRKKEGFAVVEPELELKRENPELKIQALWGFSGWGVPAKKDKKNCAVVEPGLKLEREDPWELPVNKGKKKCWPVVEPKLELKKDEPELEIENPFALWVNRGKKKVIAEPEPEPEPEPVP